MTKKSTKKVASKAQKSVKQVKQEAVKALATKSVLIDPKREYTKAEVRSILQLSERTHMTEQKGYIGFEGKGGILGESVIAFLPKSKKVKVGRKYPSGKVSVVAR